MFYLKTRHGKKIFIEADNVFDTCPSCGREHPIDIGEILKDENTSLYSTHVYCERCSKVRMHRGR